MKALLKVNLFQLNTIQRLTETIAPRILEPFL